MSRIATGARISGIPLVGAAWLLSVLTATLAAAPPEHPEAVHFKPGATSAVLQGKLTGWDMKEYSLRASKGQALKLQVTSRRINWLIVRLYPASQSSGDNDLLSSDNSNSFQWEGPLPADGEYVLRLFIRRTEARRGDSVDYRVRLAILQVNHAGGQNRAMATGPRFAHDRLEACRGPAWKASAESVGQASLPVDDARAFSGSRHRYQMSRLPVLMGMPGTVVNHLRIVQTPAERLEPCSIT